MGEATRVMRCIYIEMFVFQSSGGSLEVESVVKGIEM